MPLIGRPSTASSTAARLADTSPFLAGPPSTDSATASVPARIRDTRPVSTDFGPNSTNTRKPASYISLIRVAKSTGLRSWSARIRLFAATSAPYTAPGVFAYTGSTGARIAVPSTVDRNGDARAGAAGVREHPSTDDVGPPTTIWSGAL